MSKSESKPVPLRIEPELEAKIEEAARATGLSKADVMRLAMRIGFEDLRRINYDVAGAVVNAAKPSSGAVRYPSARDLRALSSTLNEDEGNQSARK